MKTQVLKITGTLQTEDIERAARVLRAGGLCALPTETVYGLAGNALDKHTVDKIFAVKGRPSDNPLIVHIASISDLEALVREIPQTAQAVFQRFWPGPLTVVLPKSGRVPENISGGLDTVAVRMPGNDIMRAVIRVCGFPLAAPSANLSGSPSPTRAEHVLADLDGRIDMIVDGGPCDCGLESTVLSLCGDRPRILRPGAVTHEQLLAVLPDTILDEGTTAKLQKGARPVSPGMKYRHYAPKTRLILVHERSKAFVDFVNALGGDGIYALCFDEDIENLTVPYISLGPAGDCTAHARNLYDALRSLDDKRARTAYTRAPETRGMGLALYNRLIHAAAFEVVDS